MTNSWNNIPLELRNRPQWCIAAPAGMFSVKGKEPLSLDEHGRLYMAKVTEPGMWLTFMQAATIAYQRNYQIGYVLSEDDPYSCIDFDVKDAENAPDKPELWTTRDQYEWYQQCILKFDSYTEQSAGGKGFHVWVKGKIGRGARANGIEVYSQERFMISTGRITNPRAIVDQEAALQLFAESVRPKRVNGYDFQDAPEVVDDWYVLKLAADAGNADKFLPLWNGEWQQLGYPSQSEADLALLSMFTFYSPNNAQVRRLFRDSALGKREKATKNDDYINRTLKVIRGREKAEQGINVDEAVRSLQAISEAAEQRRLATQAREALERNITGQKEIQPLHVPGIEPPPPPLPDTNAQFANSAPVAAAVVEAGKQGVPWPPGVAGRIAHFIYQSAPRPVKEVAIVASLGLLAGICGRAWHVPQSGLNMYIVLIARSAVGKEAMHSGISLIVKACTEKLPIFNTYVSFDDFASGPALTKACSQTTSFLNVSGEWGHKLKRMAKAAEDGRDQAMTTLRQQMTNLYQKSGPQAIVGGIRYSQADNNVASVAGVAYSMIGETTPGTFYEALTPSIMEDGFLSRFLNIEYNGERPASNRNQMLIPEQSLVETITAIAQSAQRGVLSTQSSIPVERSEDAAAMLAAFEEEADKEVNKTTDESYRQMWNRAALKALRVAALLAVADHHLYPTIQTIHMEWAINIVRRDIGIMKRRIETGDVGATDTTRERKMHAVIRHYFANPVPKSHPEAIKMQADGVVTRKYLQIYCSQSMAFTKAQGGTVRALDSTIKSMIDSGFMVEVEKATLVKNYSFSGKSFRVLSMLDSAAFGEENV